MFIAKFGQCISSIKKLTIPVNLKKQKTCSTVMEVAYELPSKAVQGDKHFSLSLPDIIATYFGAHGSSLGTDGSVRFRERFRFHRPPAAHTRRTGLDE